MKVLEFIVSMIDRLCIVLGAFFGSQIPEFMQQYTQRLGGHAAELNRLRDHLRVTASQSHKTLDHYIQKFLTSSDADFVQQGEFMRGIKERSDQLNQALYHLTHSPIWERPFVFIKDLQYDIAQSTFASFQPGINLSLEGICYTGIGIILGYGLFQLISKFFGIVYVRAARIFANRFNATHTTDSVWWHRLVDDLASSKRFVSYCRTICNEMLATRGWHRQVDA